MRNMIWRNGENAFNSRVGMYFIPCTYVGPFTALFPNVGSYWSIKGISFKVGTAFQNSES